MGLTNEDREALAEWLIEMPIPNPLDSKDIEASGVYGWPELQRIAAALAPAVEQIIARHVAEARASALNEAAKQVETARTRHWQMHLRDHPFADATSCPKDYGKHDAYYDAARIVRNLANSPPP